MKLQQISVFLENAPGRLYEVTSAIGAAGINLRALSLAETGDFGVLRLLVSDVVKARRLMMEMNFPAKVEEVVAVEIPDQPGSLAAMLEPLTGARVSVQYMYAFAGFTGESAVMVFRFSDNDRAIDTLQKSGIEMVDAKAFSTLENK